MNKKAQASIVLYVMFVVVVTGIILYFFSPSINTLRIDLISALDPQGQTLEKVVLYSLMPLLWIAWLVFSTFALIVTVNSSRGLI